MATEHRGHGDPMTTFRRVPLGRRQLTAQPAKLVVSVVAVAASVALVLLLSGLRRGMGEQVTLYVDRQAQVFVAQDGTRNFLSQASVLPDTLERRVARVAGVADAAPISQQYAMFRLHGRRVLALLVGYDPGRAGGPWTLSAGRRPGAPGELVLDRVLASKHGLGVGAVVDYRGLRLRVVGLSSGTSGFMTPLAFATRRTVNSLDRAPGTASFFLVRPAPGVAPATLASRIESAVGGVSALLREEIAANDRRQLAGPFSGPLRAMVAIAFAVAVLVIGLTIYTSTSERAREYATLKAIGLRTRALLVLITAQAWSLALAGTALGVLLSFGAARGVSALAPQYLIAISRETIALVAGGAVLMAIAAALLPARYLARLDPATAFRR
jgi:putative ABC transport system permease protein